MTQIPRRMHADQRHPLAPRLLIAVNGIEQRKVVSYDLDAGIVERYETDEKGRIVTFRDTVSIETVRGDVTAVLCDPR